MRHYLLSWIRWAGAMVLCACLPAVAGAISVSQLQTELASANKPTVIDVRQNNLYVKEHIPGAINVPASLCPLKRLPPLGRVVVYGEGLGPREEAEFQKAVEALSQKPGMTVDVLVGGYAAWQSAQGLTTVGRGLKPERFNYLSYAELQAADPSDVRLIDLRKLTPEVRKNSDSLTDLSREFPGRRVASSAQLQTEAKSGTTPLVVLIDSVDGSSEAAARLLKANGVRRYAILMGGELAIQRKGAPGLQRTAGTVAGTAKPAHNPPPGNAK